MTNKNPYPLEKAKPKAEDKDAALWRVLHSRLKRSEVEMKDWLDRGAATEKFIEVMAGSEALENLLTPDNGWIRAKVNKIQPLSLGMVSSVAFKNPTFTGLPLRRSPEFVGTANVEATFLNRCIEEARFDRQQRLASQDAVVYGAGFIETGNDETKEGIPTARHRRVEDVRVDTSASIPEEQTWVAFRQVMRVSTARRIYDCEDIVSDEEATRNSTKDGSGHSEGSSQESKDKSPHTEPEDEKVTLWRFILLKESLDFAIESTKVQEGEAEDSITAMLEKEGNRIVVISEHLPGKILSNKPWSFFLDKDNLPFTIISLKDQAGRLLPDSPLESVRDQQEVLNNVYTFIVTQAFTAAKLKFVGDKGQLAQDASVAQKLKSPTIGDVILLEGGILNLRTLELGAGLNQSMIQLFNITNQLFDEISGFQEMFGGMQGARSAMEASIREGRAQALSSDYRQVFERGIAEIGRKMMQIAYSNASTRLVTTYVGREDMGLMPRNVEDKEVDVNTLPLDKVISQYWDENRKPADIRRENNVILVPGSTRKVSTEREMQDLTSMMGMIRDLMLAYQQNGYRISPETLARKQNYILSRVLRVVGMHDYKQFEITDKDLNLEPSLLGRDLNASVQAKIARQEGMQEGALQAGETAEGQDKRNAEALIEFLTASGASPEEAQQRAANMTPAQRASAVALIQQKSAEQ